MYVEDKVSHRGPFPIEVTADQTLAELKKQIENEFEIPADYQKWILGKELVTNENSTLKDYNITTEGCPVFLYLVAPDPKTKVDRSKSPKTEENASPSTSKVENPPTEIKLIKEEVRVNGTPLTKPTNEDKIEKVRMNVQNLQNKLNESRNETKKIEIAKQPVKVADQTTTTQPLKTVDTTTAQFAKAFTTTVSQPTKTVDTTAAPSTKLKDPRSPTQVKVVDHTPKIVNVIPKVTEISPKKEILIPITIEQCETRAQPKPKQIPEKPISVTEIRIEEKPTTSPPQRTQQIEAKEKLDSAFPKSKSPPKSSKNDVKPKVQLVTQKTPNASTSAQKVEPGFKTELPVPKPQTSNEKKDAPKAKEEDMDDFDSKTLKPAKEWECHLCTLLNPMSSNICAVCATVRLTQAQPPKKSTKKKAPQPKAGESSAKKEHTYQQLVNLDNADLVENLEPFECVVCFLEIPPREGVTLRECLHQFCKACLAHTIEYADEAEIKCPYRDDDYSCNIALQDREVKALVSPVVYEQHLAKSVAQAENKMDKSFHCKTPDCKGWCIFEDNVNEFRCPVCRKTNCLTCQAIHSGMNCKQYQEKMNQESEIDDDARRTKEMLEEMVNKGEAIECPTCKVILMKKWGCDWLRCSMCKTEICWVTRGPRWGPGGKGDTSGGCQCGVNGVKCHPKCNYCH